MDGGDVVEARCGEASGTIDRSRYPAKEREAGSCIVGGDRTERSSMGGRAYYSSPAPRVVALFMAVFDKTKQMPRHTTCNA